MITIAIMIIIISIMKREKVERAIIITVLIVSIIIASRARITSIEILSGLFETESGEVRTIGEIRNMGVYIIIIAIIIIKQKEEKRIEYIMYLFAILGMILLISSSDIIAGLIAIELQSLALYILNIKSNKRAISAGVIYYIIGSISSVIMIIGIVIIYKSIGVTTIEGIRMRSNSETMMIVIIISLLMKLGAAPFQNWVADVYAGLTTDRTIIISSLGKISIIIYISKLNITSSISIIIIMTLIIGSIGGLSQYRIKRIMGYSSITNVGWMLIESNSESRVYIYQYFISVVIIMANLMNTKSSTSMIISIFSLSGIPPLIGFIGKYKVLSLTIINGNNLITIVLIITSVISAVYYLRIIINLNTIDKYEARGKNTLIIAMMTIYQMVYII